MKYTRTTPYQINDYIPDPNTGKDRWQIYHIFKRGMGIVYIVYDAEWREAFAVKTYQDKLQSKEAQEQFKKEANIWINLDRHENIAWARSAQNIQNRLYLFLEYVPGGDLSRWIKTKRLDLKQVLLFALQFCYGMEHALAKGVIAHRDIKPQNCLVTEDLTLKITDFGLAKALDIAEAEQALNQPSGDSITTTRTGQGGGTLPYMAPEQFDDLKHVDVRGDIYSFGIMLYEMISGCWPFTGSTYAEFREKHQKASIPDFPPFSIPQAVLLVDIIRKCLAKKPRERYSDFGLLRRELAQLYETIHGEEAPSLMNVEKLSASDLSNKGIALGDLGRHEEAIACFNKALEIDTRLAMAWCNKGKALGILGRYEEALSCCELALKHALEFDPNIVIAWYNKGNALIGLGRYEEAISCLDKALEINPKIALAWNSKGHALVSLRRYEEAISCFNQALEIDPKHIVTWDKKGFALAVLGQFEKAIICFDKALEIEPKYAGTWYNKGLALVNLGRCEEAISCYNYALKIEPKDADIWSNKGNALIMLGRYEEAISCCEHALDINPKHAIAWHNKGIALANLGKLLKALSCFQKAQQMDLPQAAQAIEFTQQLLRNKG